MHPIQSNPNRSITLTLTLTLHLSSIPTPMKDERSWTKSLDLFDLPSSFLLISQAIPDWHGI